MQHPKPCRTKALGHRPPPSLAAAAAAAASLATALSFAPAAPAAAQATAAAPEATYWAYVGAESADLIHRIRFGPEGATVERTTAVGSTPVEMEGPHGLAITPDGERLVLTTGHGIPDGHLWVYEIGPDTLIGGPTGLDRFPATVDVTPDGLYAFVVNFNLHGGHVPSSVSVVYLPEMMEVARTVTCTMPHGSRMHPSGAYQYSSCMMDDLLVEMDARTFEVSRRFSVARGAEGPARDATTAHHHGHASATMPACSPTWAQPAPDGEHVYVACNRSDEILEISFEDWTLSRRFATGRGPYNLAITPDGRLLVATLKQGNGVQVFDLASGRGLGVVPSSTTVTHGVVVSPDSRYAFVSVEGVGAEPGKVDVLDLDTLQVAASVEVGQQASGIAFWKMEPAAGNRPRR